jgi:hypothetical protein
MPLVVQVSRRAQAQVVRAVVEEPKYQRPDAAGRFGKYGGKYVPETLIAALEELEVEYKKAMADPEFQVEPLSLSPRPHPSSAVDDSAVLSISLCIVGCG